MVGQPRRRRASRSRAGATAALPVTAVELGASRLLLLLLLLAVTARALPAAPRGLTEDAEVVVAGGPPPPAAGQSRPTVDRPSRRGPARHPHWLPRSAALESPLDSCDECIESGIASTLQFITMMSSLPTGPHVQRRTAWERR
jgi:hypothetical protein